MDILQLIFLHRFVLSYGAYQSSNFTDVVSEGYAAEGLYKNEDDGFVVIVCRQVSEPDSQHDVGPPIIAPDVLDDPFRINDVDFTIPALVDIDLCHQVEKYR